MGPSINERINDRKGLFIHKIKTEIKKIIFSEKIQKIFRDCLTETADSVTPESKKLNFQIRNQPREYASRGLIVPATVPKFASRAEPRGATQPPRREFPCRPHGRAVLGGETSPPKSNKILALDNNLQIMNKARLGWMRESNARQGNQLIFRNWRSSVPRKLSEHVPAKTNSFKRHRLSTDLSEHLAAPSPEKAGKETARECQGEAV